ncbi:hypothetical protein Ddye_018152 [Dipteronia dyeriana]|uniref:Uncharacterized protein n=1 Tax=Dipteronia dyeriana TaxID=168575 RepID=A0AAD9UAN0_9ROSI|nr:hypothetical protein Ddye_018152 [Dipteronia dyeriana]
MVEKAKSRSYVGNPNGQNVTTEEAQHRNIPNKSNLPPPDEEIPGTDLLLGLEKTIATRCTLYRWTRIAKNLSEEQTEVVQALGFGNLLALNCGCLRLRICRWLVDNFDTTTCSIHIHDRRFSMNSNLFGQVLRISYQGDHICISGHVHDKVFWESKIPITSRGIYLKDIEHWLEKMTTAEDEFNMALCLFLLGTILSYLVTDYVLAGYLIPLTDVGSICRKNWSSWCFTSLYEGIQKFHMNRHQVDILYAKFSSGDDNNLDTRLHNTPGQQNSMKYTDENPHPRYTPSASSQPFSNHKK